MQDKSSDETIFVTYFWKGIFKIVKFSTVLFALITRQNTHFTDFKLFSDQKIFKSMHFYCFYKE